MAKPRLGGETVSIEDIADIRAVPSIHVRLMEAFTSSDRVILDIRCTDDFDISFLQLIESARRYATTTGKSLVLSAPAEGDLHQQLLRGGFISRQADRAFWLQTSEAM